MKVWSRAYPGDICMATIPLAEQAKPKQPARSSFDWHRVRVWLSSLLLFLLALSFLYPFLLAITTSFKPLPEINTRPVALWPRVWTTEGYGYMLRLNVGRWAFNSALIALVVTVTNVLISGMAGYALSRIRFPGSDLVFLAILGTMMVPGIVQLIP